MTMAAPIFVGGLDIGSTKTCAVLGEWVADAPTPTVKVLGVGQSRVSGVRRDAFHNLEETAESIRQALREAELMAGVQVRALFTGVAAEHAETVTSSGVVAVSGDEIDERDVERVHEVARAVVVPQDRELLHALPQDYTVDHQGGVQDPVGMLGTRLETHLFLVSANAAATRNLRRAVERAGYEVAQLVLAPLASGLAVLAPEEREIGVALVEIGGRTSEVTVFADGRLRHVGVVPVGGVHVTQDVARGLGLPYADAERLKERYGVALAQLVDPSERLEVPGPGPGQRRAVCREWLAHIIESRVDEILRLALDEVERAGWLRRLGAGAVLTGGGASLDGTAAIAEAVFGLPVRAGCPGPGLVGLADSVARPKFATAAGLALFGAQRWVERSQNGRRLVPAAWARRLGTWLREFF
jgi:cell division protein FtsA